PSSDLMIPCFFPVGRSGTLPLLRTVDSAVRQTQPTTISLAVSALPAPAVVASLVSRVGANLHEREAEAAAVNAAVQRSASDFVVLLRVPWRLDSAMLERTADILSSQPD